MSNNIMANSILGKTGTDNASPNSQGSDRLASDKHTFLKLLVAQLTNQDPLSPTEDKEFVAQLAQFTSLEQLQEINAGMGTLNTTMNQGQLMTATGFIGKDVVVTGDQITKLNNAEGDVLTTNVYFTVEDPIAKGQVTILDANKNIVFADTFGSKQAGTYPYVWQGANASGKEMPNGVYQIIISAQDQNDKTVLVKTQFTARVNTVVNESGVYKLTLDGGRVVDLNKVTEVGGGQTVGNTTQTTYADVAADGAAAASLAADSAASQEALINVGTTSSADAKKAANAAIKAAKNADDAAKAAKTAATTARKAAEETQTQATLAIAKDAQDWAEKARAFADAAQTSANDAKTKALAIDPTIEF